MPDATEPNAGRAITLIQEYAQKARLAPTVYVFSEGDEGLTIYAMQRIEEALDIARQMQQALAYCASRVEKGRDRVWKPAKSFHGGSRSCPWPAASSLVLQFLAARAGGRKSCRFFRENFPGLPTRSSRRLRLEADATVFANRKFREANMVKSVCALARPSSNSRRRAQAVEAIEAAHKALW